MKQQTNTSRSKLKIKLFLGILIAAIGVPAIAATNPTYTGEEIVSNFTNQLKWFVTNTNTKKWGDHANNDFFEKNSNFVKEIFDYTSQEIADALKEEYDTIKDTESGPDLLALRKKAREETITSDLSDAASSNVSIIKEKNIREAGRIATLIRIGALTSDDGQSAFGLVNEQTQKKLTSIATEISDSKSDNITQDIMKKVLAVQGLQSEIMAESRLEQLRSRIDTQYTNLNLVDISRAIEESNARERNKDRASTDFLLRSSAAAIR
jgi:hypothetical protein